jgi:hypothetical protein
MEAEEDTILEYIHLRYLENKSRDFKPLLLIFDLDGTLVPEDELKFNKQGEIIHRPFFEEILGTCIRLNVTLAIWSSAGENRVRKIVKSLFENRGIDLAFVFSGKKSVLRFNKETGEPYTAKPLWKIWRKSSIQNNKQKTRWGKENTLILDNTPSTYENNRGNAIPIKTWDVKSQFDVSLSKLSTWLSSIRHLDDVRHASKDFSLCRTTWIKNLWSFEILTTYLPVEKKNLGYLNSKL